MYTAHRTPEPEFQLLITSMLASLPMLTLLLCSPQFVSQNCVTVNGALVNATLQSTAAVHTTTHTVCVTMTAIAFSLGLLTHTLKTPRCTAALTLVTIVFCMNIFLIVAMIKFCSQPTFNGGQFIATRFVSASFDNSTAVCVLYAVTVLSVLHVTRWLFFEWTILLERCELLAFAFTAMITITLYIFALTLATYVVPLNGLQMFRNASTVSLTILLPIQ
ncbi:hypothetical protein [Epiphyas postvittana nucleopolyhedrovirus]|uniref:Uncharacterized protein n=2 Tax=Epiphyas postvittana nucleopolyhedrovirus TaxID=70600 RepID=Q91GM3_NPVEP|nr:hypothetical protein [Epiphyas postvittana nucleopolyhedrovirus]AAK85591.1 unknown [Epiphyas postvittana nucleopolyhedrovirus]